jgi:aryl-alcohol dehydrogenase-like predicted oxidoreductase
MESRQLGGTGIRVSRLGLGLAALGRPGYINLGHGDDLAEGRDVAAMQARAHAVLDAAWALGLRYFDAARSYGRAEAFLGSWLQARAQRPGVGSKWGYTYTADWRVDAEVHEVKEHSLERLQQQWRETQIALGTKPDLYQIHSATLDSGVLDNGEVLRALLHLKREGVAIGLTTSGVQQSEVIERACALRVDGEPVFDCVQSTWNALEPSAGKALQAAHAQGLGVIVKEALANGRLTERNRETDFADKRARLSRAASRQGVGMDALALAYCLSQPWVDCVLSGAASVKQLQENCRACDIVSATPTLEESFVDLAEIPSSYWRKRGALNWN